MKNVFVLQHARERLGGEEDVKFIGVYSSEVAAKEAVRRLQSVAGFRDFPDGFYIDEYEIDKDHWQEGFGTPPSK